MYNYLDDRESFEYFESLPIDVLINILEDNFNYIEYHLVEYAKTFKNIFNGSDYDEFYYSCLSLIEELNDIKIILNVLKRKR